MRPLRAWRCSVSTPDGSDGRKTPGPDALDLKVLLRGVNEAGLSPATRDVLLAALHRGAASVQNRPKGALRVYPPTDSGDQLLGGISLRSAGSERPQLLVIGASTGGPHAIAALLRGFERAPPVPIVVVQHMAENFIPILAVQLDGLAGLRCHMAVHGERPTVGHVYLAPGDQHLLVASTPAGLELRLSDAPAENFCRPSIDPLLRSAVAALGGAVVAVILTGMGRDGLEGARLVTASGGTVLAQDESSSAIWGMPGTVAVAGLCHAVLSPKHLAAKLGCLLAGLP